MQAVALSEQQATIELTAAQQELLALFAKLGIAVKHYQHEPAFTVEESGHLHELIPGGHCKSLFLKSKKGNYYLVVMLGEPRLSLKQLAKELKQGSLSFGSDEKLRELLGVEPGSVTPFALVNDHNKIINAILDADMLEHKILNYHPLRNDLTTSIKTKDFLLFLKEIGCESQTMALPKTS